MPREIIVDLGDKLLISIAGKIFEYTINWDDCYKPPVIKLSGTYERK